MATPSNDSRDPALKMPSSAAKIFAVSELLEAILLELDDPAVRGDDWTTAIADLFTCFRVNKTYHSTINGSKKLQQIMLLEFGKEDDEDGYPPPYGLQFLFHHTCPFPDSFVADERAARVFTVAPSMPSPVSGGNKTIHFRFQGYRDGEKCGAEGPEYIASDYHWYDDEARSRKAGEDMLERASAKGHPSSEASWRRMRLESKPDSVQRVAVGLLTAIQPAWVNRAYTGITTFDDNIETLGDLFDILHRVKYRTPSEHKRLSRAYERVHRTMDRGLEDWNYGHADTPGVKQLRILMSEHEKFCSETVERVSCAYCYCKNVENGAPGEILTEEDFGRYN